MPPADSLIFPSRSLALARRVDGLFVCACTHYLVFKEPTCAERPSGVSRSTGACPGFPSIVAAHRRRRSRESLRLPASPTPVNPVRFFQTRQTNDSVSAVPELWKCCGTTVAVFPGTKKFADCIGSANLRCPAAGCLAPNAEEVSRTRPTTSSQPYQMRLLGPLP
jgi:hypothetical protein